MKQVANKHALCIALGHGELKLKLRPSRRMVITCLVCAPAKVKIACPQFEHPDETMPVAGQPRLVRLGTAGLTGAGKWLFRQGKHCLTNANSS